MRDEKNKKNAEKSSKTINDKKIDDKKQPIDFNEIKRKKSLKVIIFVITVFFFTYLFVSQSLTVVQLRYQMSEMKEELIEFENENKILEEKIEKITTDQFIEEQARNRLGMIKTGEVPIKIIEKDITEQQKVSVIEPKEKIGIYLKDWYVQIEEWINYIKK